MPFTGFDIFTILTSNIVMLNSIMPPITSLKARLHMLAVCLLQLYYIERTSSAQNQRLLVILSFLSLFSVIGFSFLKINKETLQRGIGIEDHFHKLGRVTLTLALLQIVLLILGMSPVFSVLWLIIALFFLGTNFWLIALKRQDKSKDPIAFLSHPED